MTSSSIVQINEDKNITYDISQDEDEFNDNDDTLWSTMKDNDINDKVKRKLKNYRKGFVSLSRDLTKYKEESITNNSKIYQLEKENKQLKSDIESSKEEYELEISKLKLNYSIYKEDTTKQNNIKDEQLDTRNHIINQLTDEIKRLDLMNKDLHNQLSSVNNNYKLLSSKMKLNSVTVSDSVDGDCDGVGDTNDSTVVSATRKLNIDKINHLSNNNSSSSSSSSSSSNSNELNEEECKVSEDYIFRDNTSTNNINEDSENYEQVQLLWKNRIEKQQQRLTTTTISPQKQKEDKWEKNKKKTRKTKTTTLLPSSSSSKNNGLVKNYYQKRHERYYELVSSTAIEIASLPKLNLVSQDEAEEEEKEEYNNVNVNNSTWF